MQMPLSEMASDKLNHFIFQLKAFYDKLCQKMKILKTCHGIVFQNMSKLQMVKKCADHDTKSGEEGFSSRKSINCQEVLLL